MASLYKSVMIIGVTGGAVTIAWMISIIISANSLRYENADITEKLQVCNNAKQSLQQTIQINQLTRNATFRDVVDGLQSDGWYRD